MIELRPLQQAMPGQADADAPAMFRDELHPAGLERPADGRGVRTGDLRNVVEGIGSPDRRHAEAGGIRQLLGSPAQQGTAGPNLRTGNRGSMHHVSPLSYRMIG